MGWSLFRVPQSLTGDPKATCAVRDRGAQEFSKRRSQSFPSLLGVESSDDGAAAPHPAGGGEGSCDPPTGSADGFACCAGGTLAQGCVRRQGRGRVGAAAAAVHRRSAALLCGGGGALPRAGDAGVCRHHQNLFIFVFSVRAELPAESCVLCAGGSGANWG